MWYNNIVANAKSRILDKSIYTENHHAIPKSLGGGNDKSNLVRLTAREHFICHMLLVKMINDPPLKAKMQFALNAFRRSSNNQNRHIPTSKQYEILRKAISEARSMSLVGNTFGLGTKRTDEQKARMAIAQRGIKKRARTESEREYLSSINKGIPKKETTKQKMRKPKSTEHRENIRKARLGKTLSEETRKKISESRLKRQV